MIAPYSWLGAHPNKSRDKYRLKIEAKTITLEATIGTTYVPSSDNFLADKMTLTETRTSLLALFSKQENCQALPDDYTTSSSGPSCLCASVPRAHALLKLGGVQAPPIFFASRGKRTNPQSIAMKGVEPAIFYYERSRTRYLKITGSTPFAIKDRGFDSFHSWCSLFLFFFFSLRSLKVTQPKHGNDHLQEA